MHQRNKTLSTPTLGMEIVDAAPRQPKTVTRQTEPPTSKDGIGSFGIVETVSGPVAGTFGLSEVWENT